MQGLYLKCQLCARRHAITRPIPWCDCGGVFDLQFKPSRLEIHREEFSLWRYRGVLPINSPVTLGEPITPIVKTRVGGREVAAKLDYLMPSGSFKDRGAAVLASAIREAGIDRCMEDSSGNAGAALAAYAARAGIRCDIYCPSSTAPAKTIQIERSGAALHRIDGPRESATAALMARAGEVFYASHNWHPLFLHGVKTMAYEIAEQYGGSLPKHIVAPAGGGSVLLGLHLGFTELIGLSRVDSMPRLHAVQAEACAPLVQDPVHCGPSIAEGILTVRPPRLSMLKNVVSSVAVVSEDEILQGFRELTAQGLNAEPTSAVVVPALPKLGLPENESVLVILTGSGLKSTLI